jgi:chromate transport protein ChrA
VTSRALALLVWALLGAATVGLAVMSVARHRWLSTLRAALQALVASPWRRPLVILGWMWLGWHLFAR